VLRAALQDALTGNRKGTLVFSCLRDKRVEEMGKILFPLFDEVIVAPIHNARANATKDLLAAANAAGFAAVAAESVGQALELAAQRTQNGVVVVSGSVYLVGEARSLLLAEREGQ
jgi:dihydrofolate synthase/folylpolyglutamate synthase